MPERFLRQIGLGQDDLAGVKYVTDAIIIDKFRLPKFWKGSQWELNELDEWYKVEKVRKLKGSFCVTLPKRFVKSLNLAPRDIVTLTPVKRTIEIIPYPPLKNRKRQEIHERPIPQKYQFPTIKAGSKSPLYKKARRERESDQGQEYP